VRFAVSSTPLHQKCSDRPVGALGDKCNYLLIMMVTILISWMVEYYVVCGVTPVSSITFALISVSFPL
jgi:hypothetical protein